MENMNAFISYQNADINFAKKVKEFLDDIKINAFIANDDLRNGTDWKEAIKESLQKSSLFIPLLSEKFKKSDWCSQEIGIAYGMNMAVVPISTDGTRSYGFISNVQSKSIMEKDILLLLCEGLLNTYFDYGIKAIIKMLEKPISFYYSEQIFELIEPYFDKINNTDINEICKCSIENGQVWPARMCARKYIPELLNMRENDIDRTTYIQLKYQIENQTWYRDD